MIFKSYLIERDLNLLKNNFALFYGENLGLKNDFKKIIKFNFSNSEIIIFSQDEIVKNETTFLSNFLNLSLFVKEKIFIIDNVNDKILTIIENIISNKENQKIFLFAEILDKRSKLRNYFEKNKSCDVVPCYSDTEINLNKIIINKLKNFKNLTPHSISIILENCNLDRDKLYNELDKIIIFFENKEINLKDLKSLLNNVENDDFDNLKDEALSGNIVKTNELISKTILEREKNYLYLNIICQRLNRLADVYEKMKKTNLESAINNLKPPVFWKDKPKMITQAKKWNKKKISRILQKIYEIEIKIKSNSLIDGSLLLKNLMLDLCVEANA